MPIASRLKWFLDVNQARYDVLHSAPSPDAEAPAVSPDQLVVSKLFRDAHGYLMVVLPASHRVAMSELEKLVGRSLHPVKASALRDIFFDCEQGAVPPIGPAYGVPTVVDDSLPFDRDLYFSGGEGEALVHMSGADFSDLVAEARHGRVSQSF